MDAPADGGGHVDFDDERRRRGGSFGAAAALYDTARPSYPSEAFDAVLRDAPRHVLDLAAGTGIFTRLLLARGVSVIAAEPSAEMAARLRARSPEAVVRTAPAEDLPLADASVDAVACAQAWHWVEPMAATEEVARVLRPGGTLALIWNHRDLEVDWLGRAFDLIHLEPAPRAYRRTVPRVAAPFGHPVRLETRWTDRITREGFRDLVGSFSDMLVRPEEERRATAAQVDALFDEHPDLVGRAEVEVPYLTETLLYRRP
jgi:SAM-dependent methyltransferase